MKKILLAFLGLLCFQFCLSQTFSNNGFTYSVISGTDQTVQVLAAPCQNSVNVPVSVSNDGTAYTVVRINFDVFNNCTLLTEVTLPDSITSIGQFAFAGCTNLLELDLPDNLATIGRNAFFNCSSLQTITIPASLSVLSESAFSNCDGLTEVILNQGLERIGDSAFSQCDNITSLEIPNSVTSIGVFALSNSPNLTSITFQDNPLLQTLEFGAFSATGITTIDLPNSLNTVEGFVFQSCSALTEVNLPNSITSLGESIYENCDALTSIVNWPNQISEIPVQTFEGCDNLANVVIPSNILTIGERAFRACNSLSSVTIPEGVASIERLAFENTPSLSAVNIPSTVTSISERCFNNSGLTSVGLPNALLSIGDQAFSACANLTSVTFPNTLIELGSRAFENTGLTSVTIPNTITNFDFAIFRNCTNLSEINLEEGISQLGQSMFQNCTALINVVLPQSLTAIPNSIFEDCTNLANVNIPPLVVDIESDAFRDCSNLQSVEFPESVSTIGEFCFSGCSSLTSVALPNVELISRAAFQLCTSLETVEFNPNNRIIDAFVFINCSNLVNVELVEGIEEIRFSSFASCENLESINLPSTIYTIGSGIVDNSLMLMDVTVNWDTPLAVNANVFNTQDLSTLTLFVPEGTEALYQAAPVWQDFGTILPNSPVVVSILDSNFEQALIDLGIDSDATLNGQILESDALGVTDLDINSYNISDISGIEFFADLEVLTAFNNLLTSVDLSQNTQLGTVVLAMNDLTEIDVSNLSSLQTISLNDNALSSIDLSNNSMLTQVFLNLNGLTEVDVSMLSNLQNLGVSSNSIVELDISQNLNLSSLFCENNNLVSLIVSNGNNTNFTNFEATNNPDLSCIQVDDVAYSTANWTNIDDQSFFGLDCAPSNDDCFEATTLTLGALTSGTTLSATSSLNLPSCQDDTIALIDVWYQFTAPSSGTITAIASSVLNNLNVNLAIYTDCIEAEPISCDSGTVEVTNLIPGETYLLQIWIGGNVGGRASLNTSIVGDFTLEVMESSILSNPEVEMESSFQLFPNPAQSQLHIQSNSKIDAIAIFDLTGKQVFNQTTVNRGSISLNLAHLNKGVYIVQIKKDTNIYNKKLIIK